MRLLCSRLLAFANSRRSPAAALTLNFLNNVLDSKITFTRASTATYFDSAGLVASAANNVARFDYDPATLALRGLLVEESRTNLLNWSQTFATTGGTQNNWVDSASLQRVSTTRTSPDGTGNALEIKANGAADQTIISSAAVGTSAQRVFSVFLKRVTGTGQIQYTLDNGATWTSQTITNAWVRYTFAETTANHQVGIRIRTSGDVIQIWGAQLEAGGCPSSYIPTLATTAQRQADVATVTTLSPWYNATEGTLYSEFIQQCSDATNNRGITSLHDTLNNNRIAMFVPASATQVVAARVVSETIPANPADSAPFVANQTTRSALAYGIGTNQAALSVNGATPTFASPAASPVGVNILRIGAVFGVNQIGGWIREIKYYSRRLKNNELTGITRV